MSIRHAYAEMNTDISKCRRWGPGLCWGSWSCRGWPELRWKRTGHCPFESWGTGRCQGAPCEGTEGSVRTTSLSRNVCGGYQRLWHVAHVGQITKKITVWISWQKKKNGFGFKIIWGLWVVTWSGRSPKLSSALLWSHLKSTKVITTSELTKFYFLKQ